MYQIYRIILPGAAALLLAGGCVTVNPNRDYQRTTAHIERATGSTHTFQSENAELVQTQVRALLAGGITLDEAVAIALLNNSHLQAAFFDIGLARADVVQASLLSNPSLGVSLRLPSSGGLANFEAGLAQNIADLWRIPVRKRAAERNLDRTILTVARQATVLASKAKTAYFAALAANQRLDIAKDNLKVARTVLELAKIRKQAGAGSQLDVNLALGVHLEAELAVHQAQFAAAQARRELARILGVTIAAEELSLLDTMPDATSFEMDAEVLIKIALRERLDIQAALNGVRASEERLVLEYRRVFPTVEIGVALERAERGRSKGSDFLGDTARSSIAAGGLTAPGIQPRSEQRKNTDSIIGPSLLLEIPIFDQNQAQIARARFELEQALRVLQGLERSIRQDVQSAADRARTAWRLLKVYRERSLPLAESNLDLSREAYQAGRASFLSVLEAQRFFLDTRRRYVAAAEGAALTIPDVERTIGLPFDELMKRARSEPESGRNEEVEP